MKHAYLIMAHHEIPLLKLLLSKLDHPDNTLFIHLDKRGIFDLEDIRTVVKQSDVRFIKRMKVLWGGYSQIQCELNLLQEAIKGKYDYYHLITGVDLPIKSIEEINQFFERSNGKEFVFIDWAAVEANNFLTRYNQYHFFTRCVSNKKTIQQFYRIINFVLRSFAKILNSLHIRARRNFDNFKFVKGSAYFDITHEAAEYVIQQKKLIRKIFRFTNCCDEVFLQTVLHNSKFCDRITPSLRYADWSENGSHPATLTIDHFDSICQSPALFARKFSTIQSKALIDKLYNSNATAFSD